MKITAGLGSIDEYVRYGKAGADEFFCGYVPYEWNKKYGTILPLNRREVLGVNVQIGAESELKILAAFVEKYKIPVHLTFNSLFYVPEQYPEIADMIRTCIGLGFSSFIIADPALLVYLRAQKIRCEIHISGETSEVNSRMMDVFDRLHASRLIFHRKNSFSDMEAVIRHEKQKESGGVREFEAFALNELCQFSGSFCNSLHCDEMGYLCRVPYRLGNISACDERGREAEQDMAKENGSEENRKTDHQDVREVPDTGRQKTFAADPDDEERKYDPDGYLCGESGCGLCALFRLRQAGITHLKLVGRGNYVDFMEKDIRNLKTALAILEESETEEEYRERMKRRIFPHGCSGRCYYL